MFLYVCLPNMLWYVRCLQLSHSTNFSNSWTGMLELHGIVVLISI